MATPEQIAAWIAAINAGATPEQIQSYAGAVGSGIPPEVASNPSAYGYDYGSDPTGLGYLRNEAFLPSNTYDYRTDPGYLQTQRDFDYANRVVDLDKAHTLGNLDVLEPVTIDDIYANRDKALRGLDASYESRGLYQSGERALERANTTGDYERQAAGVRLTGALQRGNAEYDAARALMDIQRRQANTLANYATPPTAGAPPG